MAPSFASLRTRRRERSASRQHLDDRYGDASISAPNEGATWVEWTSPPSTPELSPSTSPTKEGEEPAKASITITINLPWQKTSRTRSTSLPPTAARVRETRSAELVRQRSGTQNSQITTKSPRPSPPTHQTSHATYTTTHKISHRPSSRPTPPTSYAATPSLTLLSPLTESFDDPRTPASVTSDFMTSIENSPSSPFKKPSNSDNDLSLLRPRKLPSPEATEAYTRARQARPPLIRSNSPDHPHYLPRPTSGRWSPTNHPPPPRSQSVDPSTSQQGRRLSDEDQHHYGHAPTSKPSTLDDSDSDTTRPPRPRRSNSTTRPLGRYDEVTSEYRQIRRMVDADHNQQQQQQQQHHHHHHNSTSTSTRRPGNGKPGGSSAGSGILSASLSASTTATSATSKGLMGTMTVGGVYMSGPQELVPSGEDLWS